MLDEKVAVTFKEPAVLLVPAKIPGFMSSLVDKSGRATDPRDKARVKVADDCGDALWIKRGSGELQAVPHGSFDIAAVDRSGAVSLFEQQHRHAADDIFPLIHFRFA